MLISTTRAPKTPDRATVGGGTWTIRLILIVALLARPLTAQALPKTLTLTERHFVCKSFADADHLVRLSAHGDASAVYAFIQSKQRELSDGTEVCRYLPVGEDVTVSDSAQGSVTMMECFRPSGYARCFWGILIPAQ